MHFFNYVDFVAVFSDLGRNPTVLSVEDGVVRVCRGNGSILHLSIAAFPEKLLKHVAANMWQVALQVNKICMITTYISNKVVIVNIYILFNVMAYVMFQLCRTVEDETLWACLAVLAWQNHQLAVAEEAFALIHQYHQVCYIQQLMVSVTCNLNYKSLVTTCVLFSYYLCIIFYLHDVNNNKYIGRYKNDTYLPT